MIESFQGVKINKFNTGNVGIGTTNPQAGLHGIEMNGMFLWTDSETDDGNKNGRWGISHYDTDDEPFIGVNMAVTSSSNIIAIGGSTSQGNAATEIRFTTASNNTTTGTVAMTIDSSGDVQVGIEDTGSQSNLVISGAASGNEGGEIRLSMSDDHDDNNSNDNWTIDVFQDDLRLFPSGEGAAAGAFISPGDNAWTWTSDIRIKKNIVPIDHVLEKIDEFNCVYYQRKKQSDDKVHVGVVAQELQKAFPELVGQSGEDNMLNVKYSLLGPVAIQGLKEMKKLVKEQQSQIAALQSENNNLKAKMKKVEETQAENEVFREELRQVKAIINSISSSGKALIASN